MFLNSYKEREHKSFRMGLRWMLQIELMDMSNCTKSRNKVITLIFQNGVQTN